jgi:peptide/nickel transport system permease protein
MARYLIRRLIQAVFVLWAAFTVSFAVLYMLPSNPVAILLSTSSGGAGSTASTAQVAAITHEYGFDKPMIVQYGDHLWNALQGDLGDSVQTGASVTNTLFSALPSTLELAGAALLLAIVGGAGLAVWSNLTRSRPLRQVLLSLPPLGAALPSFWIGLMLAQVVSFQWRLLPAVGNQGFKSLILPAVTLAVLPGATIAQVLAKSLGGALDERYVTTALAKGASRTRVLLRHALRNAIIPTLTLAGVLCGNLLAGSVVVETVFSRTGIGQITQTAVQNQDIPVVQGLVLLGAIVFVAVNLVVDLLYTYLDPRIVFEGAPT